MTDKNELLDYLAKSVVENTTIPSIPELSRQLGISPASIREQLEVAKRLGVVEVRPKVGIQPRAFSLNEAMSTALAYGLAVDDTLFDQLSDLRKHLESSYWFEAVSLLTTDDIELLQELIDQAVNRIRLLPIQIPEKEHRDFHVTIYKRLNNPIVLSLLESYWEVYHKVGVTLLMDKDYLVTVWVFHQQMVDALRARDFEKGYQALLTHMDLVYQVRKSELKQRFE